LGWAMSLRLKTNQSIWHCHIGITKQDIIQVDIIGGIMITGFQIGTGLIL